MVETWGKSHLAYLSLRPASTGRVGAARDVLASSGGKGSLLQMTGKNYPMVGKVSHRTGGALVCRAPAALLSFFFFVLPLPDLAQRVDHDSSIYLAP